jgi:hypothetical protein
MELYVNLLYFYGFRVGYIIDSQSAQIVCGVGSTVELLQLSSVVEQHDVLWRILLDRSCRTRYPQQLVGRTGHVIEVEDRLRPKSRVREFYSAEHILASKDRHRKSLCLVDHNLTSKRSS